MTDHLSQSVSPPLWMRDRFPSWSKRALAEHREHQTRCPECDSKEVTLFLVYPGRYKCWKCRHAWTDDAAVVSAYIPNPEAS